MKFLIVLLTMCFSTIATLQGQTPSTPMPITPETVDLLSQVAILGRGLPTSFAWSADNTRLAVGSGIGVWLYDVAHPSAEPVWLNNGLDNVNFVDFSPDGQTIAVTGCTDRYFASGIGSICTRIVTQIYDLATNIPIAQQQIDHEGSVRAVAFDGRRALVFSEAGILRSLTMEGITTVLLDTGTRLNAASISVIGRRVAFTDGITLHVLGLDTLNEAWMITNTNTQHWNNLRFDESGDLLFRINTYNPSHEVYDANDGRPLWAFKDWVDGPPTILSFKIDRILVYKDEAYRWFNPRTGEPLDLPALPPLEADYGFSLAQFSPDETYFAYADRQSALRLHNFRTGTTELLYSFTKSINQLIFTPDSEQLIATSFRDSEQSNVSVWDVPSRQQISFDQQPRVTTATPFLMLNAWRAEFEFGVVTITHAFNDEVIAILPVAGIVRSIAFSPDGQLFVTAGCNNLDGMDGCWDEAGLLTFWETETWTELGRLDAGYISLGALAFSPDGTVLATGNDRDGVIKLWQVNDGDGLLCLLCEPRSTLLEAVEQQGLSSVESNPVEIIEQVEPPLDMGLSQDGNRVAIATEAGVWIYALADLSAQAQFLPTDIAVKSPVFSPDGTRLIALQEYGVSGFRLWNTVTGQALSVVGAAPCTETYSGIVAAAFTSDNTRIALLCTRSIEIIDLNTLELVNIIRFPILNMFDDLIFNEDRTLLLADQSGRYRSGGTSVWQVATGQEVAHENLNTGAFRADGMVIVAGSWFGGAVVLEAGADRTLLNFAREDHLSHTLNTEGTVLVAQLQNGDAIFYDLATRTIIRLLPEVFGSDDIALSADATVAVSRFYENDSIVIRVWDVVVGQLIAEIR